MKALFYPEPFETSLIPHIYREIYISRVYRKIENGKTAVDLGANIGLVSEFLKDKFEKVYAVEPAVEHFEALKANKEYNKWENVEIFNLAIADKDGERELYHHNDNRTSHSLIEDNGDGGEMVKTKRIDTFFKENNIEEVDMLKVDIESAEEILFKSEGFRNVRKQIKNMMVEFHGESPEVREMMKVLKKLDFREFHWLQKWIAYIK